MSLRIKSTLATLNAGRLGSALEEAKAGLREDPGSVDLRWLYCQLLCLKQDWSKARAALEQLRAVAKTPQVMQQALLTERLIEGESRRNEVWTAGRAPEFLDEIGETERLSLQAWTYRREGQWERYRALIDERDSQLTPTPVRWHNERFLTIRDLDEPSAPFLELISVAGIYIWLPWRKIVNLTVEPPVRPLEFLWVPVRVKLSSGGELSMYANALYPSRDETEERFLLGNETEWGGDESTGFLGRGKKLFLLGDDTELTIHEFGTMEFEGDV